MIVGMQAVCLCAHKCELVLGYLSSSKHSFYSYEMSRKGSRLFHLGRNPMISGQMTERDLEAHEILNTEKRIVGEESQ